MFGLVFGVSDTFGCLDLVRRTGFGVSMGGRDTNKKKYICTLSARIKHSVTRPSNNETHSTMPVHRDFTRIFDTIKTGGRGCPKTSLIKSVIIAKRDIIFLIDSVR